jgi:hypothetical protein
MPSVPAPPLSVSQPEYKARGMADVHRHAVVSRRRILRDQYQNIRSHGILKPLPYGSSITRRGPGPSVGLSPSISILGAGRLPNSARPCFASFPSGA